MNQIKRKPVKSSNLKSIGYDSSLKVLEVEFLNGALYQYSDVPADAFMELMAAESHGVYFCANIKPVYEFKKVS